MKRFGATSRRGGRIFTAPTCSGITPSARIPSAPSFGPAIYGLLVFASVTVSAVLLMITGGVASSIGMISRTSTSAVPAANGWIIDTGSRLYGTAIRKLRMTVPSCMREPCRKIGTSCATSGGVEKRNVMRVTTAP